MTEYRVHVTGYAPQRAEAVVTVESIPRGRRIRGAVARFVPLFLAAIASVLIPVAHFILVPSFLLAAFITLFQRLALSSRVVSARGRCPDCGADQDLDVPRQWRLPVGVTCRACQRPLTLTAAV